VDERAVGACKPPLGMVRDMRMASGPSDKVALFYGFS